jgi:acid phosphatase family membrane protein YuiD
MLLAACISWAIAQLIKFFVELYKHKKFDFTRLFGSGGMPSSHTSFTIALVVSVGKYQGFDSAVFAVAACLALVTMYDAAGVRRAAGQHAEILNYMMDHWKNAPELFEKDLKELLGHTPIEVLGGLILGIVVGLLV